VVLVVVVWCGASVLFGLALAACFRNIADDNVPPVRLAYDRLDEPEARDDALTRDLEYARDEATAARSASRRLAAARGR
jgi:hypothetical protein